MKCSLKVGAGAPPIDQAIKNSARPQLQARASSHTRRQKQLKRQEKLKAEGEGGKGGKGGLSLAMFFFGNGTVVS